MRLALAWLLGSLLVPAAARAANPSALWEIVSGKCVPDEQQQHNPAPCAEVDLAQGFGQGFAVLKDLVGVAQFLLIPTARISGIEDPAILMPGATNYWDAAWQARHFTAERLDTPLRRDEVSLAINSVFGRTQNQLHIHIDCVRTEVHDVIMANLDKVSTVWTPFPQPLAGHAYQAIRIPHETLEQVDPFRVLADGDPSARSHMAVNTLVLVGADFADGGHGFVLLDSKANLAAGDRGSGEELQDHSCAIAKR